MNEHSSATSPGLLGYIDHRIGLRVIGGWTFNQGDPDGEGVSVSLRVRGAVWPTIVRQNIPRPDLVEYGNGRHGFRIEVEKDLSAMDILSGLVEVESRANNETKILPLATGLRVDLSLAVISELVPILRKARSPAMSDNIQHLAKAMRPDVRLPIVALLNDLIEGPVESKVVEAAEIHDHVSTLAFPVGLTSGDRDVVIGKAGHLFLVGGTNWVSELYRRSPESVAVRDAAYRWVSLIRQRKQKLNQLGVQFIQTIIPEKQSLIGRLMPTQQNTPTPLLLRIESLLDADSDLSTTYVSSLKALQAIDGVEAFRRVDSHLTAYGAYAVFVALAEGLGYEEPPPSLSETILASHGDLSLRFFGRPPYDLMPLYDAETISKGRCLIADRTVGRHIGQSQSWVNEEAPIRKRLLAFGNSFMNGGSYQGSLGFWLSSKCLEFNFLFSPEIDLDLVNFIKPDIVICQTIERFLESHPNA